MCGLRQFLMETLSILRFLASDFCLYQIEEAVVTDRFLLSVA
jgi:hypothetical protein